MATEGTLSAAQVLNPTQPMSELSRRTMNTTNEEFAMNDFRLLINGRLVEGAGTLDVINPATGRVLTTAPRADLSQMVRRPPGSTLSSHTTLLDRQLRQA